MNPWIYLLDRRPGPVWRNVLASLETAIRTRQVLTGEVLPPQRLMADFMGVHTNTVNRAMREAARRGFVSAHTRPGTTVIARPKT